MLELELRTEYDDPRIAESIHRALEPDNKGYVESILEGKSILFKIKAKDAGSMRATADDLLACLKLAEEASGIVVSAANLDGDPSLE